MAKISGEAFDKKNAARKRDKEIENLVIELHSSEEVIVLDAIEKTRELGDAKMIPALVGLLVDKENPENVTSAVRKLLNQLKTPDVLPYLFDTLEDPKTEGFRNQIVASIWESGLNPHEYLDQLISLAIDEDYLTCLEVLTVVENFVDLPSEDSLQENLQRINSALPFAQEQKELLESLSEVIQNLMMS